MLFLSFKETILNDLKSMPYKVEIFARQVFYSLLLFDFHNDFFVKNSSYRNKYLHEKATKFSHICLYIFYHFCRPLALYNKILNNFSNFLLRYFFSFIVIVFPICLIFYIKLVLKH